MYVEKKVRFWLDLELWMQSFFHVLLEQRVWEKLQDGIVEKTENKFPFTIF